MIKINLLKYKFIKECFDRFLGLILLILMLPLLLLISLLILMLMGKPIFFIQRRVGYRCNSFNLIKFRTMKSKKYKKGKLLKDEQRLTSFGRFLRNSSIDELPEIINIIKGDLSFIGPRPLLEKYITLYDENQIQRHNVKPGLSGWAQVNGRNSISWEKKFYLDNWYIKNQSFRLDCLILLKTIFKVIKMESINYSNEVTMEEFKGNKK